MDWTVSLGEFCIHRELLGQRMISRYKEKLPKGGVFTVNGLFEAVGPCVWGADSAQQMPNKVLRSNACNAAPGKVLAKCENPLCLRHFGEH
jgi:hypothetical protein